MVRAGANGKNIVVAKRAQLRQFLENATYMATLAIQQTVLPFQNESRGGMIKLIDFNLFQQVRRIYGTCHGYENR